MESIGEHLLELEAKFPLPPLSYSAFFGPSQRIKCVSLISKNCASLGLRVETQFLAFEIFHRICTAPSFIRYHSALKAAASLYIAAKYQEVCPPRVMAFAGFSPEQTILPENVIKLEGEILQHLDFNLGYALPVHFVQLLASRYSLSSLARTALVRLCLSAVVN